MRYLLDTNSCIYLLNGNESLKKKDFDILIASIAIINHCVLITNNVEHFNRIDDLQIQSWLGKDSSATA